MLLLPILGRIPAYPAFCALDLPGFKMFPASLITFVTACNFSTIRAYTFHIPVRKESLIMRAISKPYDLRIHIPTLDQCFNDAIRPCMICGRIGVPEDAEFHFHCLEYCLKMLVIFINKFSRSDLLLLCVYNYRSPMGI